jgi:MSHA biogenesis protein MshP
MYLNYQKQRGSALVIAVFVIVVMLALTVGLSRLLISSSETVVYEVQGTRAFFAAQSALEIALPALFPIVSSASSECPETRNIDFNGIDGLRGCSATVECAASYTTEEATIYRLESIGQCIANEFTTSRTVQIEVRQ